LSGIVPEQASGGGTQYTDGAVAPANPVGTIPVFDNAGTITAVSDVNPLPVTASFTPSGTQDVDVVANTIGLATEVTLSALNTKVTAVNTGAVVVSSSALPSGAAIAANQQTDALTDTQLRATPVPVSGTVTATPSGTQNVDVTANAIGLSTGAKQDAQTALLTTIDADTSNISTKIDTIAGAVSGTEMQVDVLTLPAITGSVTANAGTNLNTSLLALESGGNLAAILADTTNIETAVQLIDDTVPTVTVSVSPTVTTIVESCLKSPPLPPPPAEVVDEPSPPAPTTLAIVFTVAIYFMVSHQLKNKK